MGLLSFSKLFLIIAWFRVQGLGSTYSGSQPPPLRGPSFQRKEGRMPASLHRHFERMREIFFVPFFHDPFAKPFRGSTASVLPRYGVSRSLLSNTLRLTANEKDPSTALGMTKRRKDLFPFLFISLRKPTSAPKGRIRIKCSAVLCKSIYESSIIKQVIWTG